MYDLVASNGMDLSEIGHKYVFRLFGFGDFWTFCVMGFLVLLVADGGD